MPNEIVTFWSDKDLFVLAVHQQVPKEVNHTYPLLGNAVCNLWTHSKSFSFFRSCGLRVSKYLYTSIVNGVMTILLQWNFFFDVTSMQQEKQNPIKKWLQHTSFCIVWMSDENRKQSPSVINDSHFLLKAEHALSNMILLDQKMNKHFCSFWCARSFASQPHGCYFGFWISGILTHYVEKSWRFLLNLETTVFLLLTCFTHHSASYDVIQFDCEWYIMTAWFDINHHPKHIPKLNFKQNKKQN